MKAPWDADAEPLETPEVARAKRTLLDRIDQFRARHPQVKIGASFTTASGNWEVFAPGKDAEEFANGWDMIQELERRSDAGRYGKPEATGDDA